MWACFKPASGTVRTSENNTVETDCVAGHVGLELRNVVANYPFESSRGFPGSERRRQEQGLDEALENTFPASDPVSVEQPTTSGRACRS